MEVRGFLSDDTKEFNVALLFGYPDSEFEELNGLYLHYKETNKGCDDLGSCQTYTLQPGSRITSVTIGYYVDK